MATSEGGTLAQSEPRDDKSVGSNPSQSMRTKFDGILTRVDSNPAFDRSNNRRNPESSSPSRVSWAVLDCEPCPFGFCLERIQMRDLRLTSKIERSSDKSRVSSNPAVTIYRYQIRYQRRNLKSSSSSRHKSCVCVSSSRKQFQFLNLCPMIADSRGSTT